jgi:predicted porin
MKKSLFALAAVTAFAGAAQAQSSVTVYGIIDVGFMGGHEKGSTGTLRSNQVTFNNVGQEFGQSAQSTSRLGFRGTEDLGGGRSAFFTIEMALTPNGQSALSAGGSSNRQTFVGLAQKGVGRAAFGTQYTPLFSNAAATSPGQFNNVAGDIIWGAQSGQSTVLNTPLTGGGPSASNTRLQEQNANTGTDIGFTVRTANMLRIDTDSFSGFRGQAFYTMDNSTTKQGVPTGAGNTGVAGGLDQRNGWGLGASYTWKKLFVGANYQSLTATNPYTINAGSITAGTPAIFGTGNNTGVNIKDNQWFAGAMYDFGILKAYAQYINRKVTSQIDATQFATRTAQQIGVRGNWTPKVESWASIGTGRYDSFGANAPSVNFNGWQLGTNYILSKRTNLYGIYGATNTGTSSAGSYYNGAQYALGVRHTF